jgi:hypothetical protein
MYKTKLRFSLILIAGISLWTAGAINAAAATIGPFTTSTPIPSTLTEWSSGFQFPRFDPSKGTLTNVRLVVQGDFTSQLTVQVTGGGVANGNAAIQLLYSVQDVGLNLATPQLIVINSPPSFNYTLNTGQSLTGPVAGSSSSARNYTSPAVLSEFSGLGNITLSAATETQLLLANHGADVVASQVTNASLTGTVTYTYTPVPEPSTLALGALGATAVLAARRRLS